MVQANVIYRYMVTAIGIKSVLVHVGTVTDKDKGRVTNIKLSTKHTENTLKMLINMCHAKQYVLKRNLTLFATLSNVVYSHLFCFFFWWYPCLMAYRESSCKCYLHIDSFTVRPHWSQPLLNMIQFRCQLPYKHLIEEDKALVLSANSAN